ncbi:ferritin-like domain-containing protein [Marivibrio halodurans]|uniref:Ferritin-like domain-containing protein n=1 Tax=Marivibrio halodurans TaxID=2039722 RepID=A0A8J7V4E8_9PROT|nr:ferritin-like domain-containing protein [Marivibrio halodurans]MBP5859002.1 ferritin-like domain-containing protein [Marivibrio halodurans]
MKAGWTLDDIAWDKFDADKVNPEVVKLIKAAALVEHNGADYTEYLCNVFSGDPEFQDDVRVWGREEIQHGKALAAWAEKVDPSFDFDAAFQRFLDGYRLPLEATDSVRGSRSGELVARCIVETGTSSFYSAIAESTDEPVLKQICRAIAADEFRHYKLFYDSLRKYLDVEGLGRLGRLKVAIGRINETEDDELSYAYYAANLHGTEDYDRERCHRLYMAPVYKNYRRQHMDRAVSMIAKASGIRLYEPVRKAVARIMLNRIHRQAEKFEAVRAEARAV